VDSGCEIAVEGLGVNWQHQQGNPAEFQATMRLQDTQRGIPHLVTGLLGLGCAADGVGILVGVGRAVGVVAGAEL